MKELIKRLRRSPTASEFLCLSDLYGKMHEERVEAADALERLTAENTQLENTNVWQATKIAEHLDTIERLTAENAALKEAMGQPVPLSEWQKLTAECAALRAGLAAALDFAGTVAGGSSWWEDVWKEHDAAIAGEKHD